MTGKIQSLQKAHVIRKDAPAAVQTAEAAVQTFNSIRGIEYLPGSLRKLEHRTDHIPVLLPALHSTRIFLVPFLCDFLHSGMTRLFIRRVIDGLQVVRKRLFVLVRNVFQRISTYFERHVRYTADAPSWETRRLWLL